MTDPLAAALEEFNKRFPAGKTKRELPCDMCCLHAHCVSVCVAGDVRCAHLVCEVKDEISRNRTLEFLQGLEARKLEAEPVELEIIEQYETYLRDTLEPDHD